MPQTFSGWSIGVSTTIGEWVPAGRSPEGELRGRTWHMYLAPVREARVSRTTGLLQQSYLQFGDDRQAGIIVLGSMRLMCD